MTKPKLTWANIKRDKWFLFQLTLVVSVIVYYYFFL